MLKLLIPALALLTLCTPHKSKTVQSSLDTTFIIFDTTGIRSDHIGDDEKYLRGWLDLLDSFDFGEVDTTGWIRIVNLDAMNVTQKVWYFGETYHLMTVVQMYNCDDTAKYGNIIVGSFDYIKLNKAREYFLAQNYIDERKVLPDHTWTIADSVKHLNDLKVCHE